MKKILPAITIFLLNSLLVFSQSVGINNTAPHASAILDVKSFNKGILIPRTSTTSRNAIANPAKGLMLYDTTTSAFWFYTGSKWRQVENADSSVWSSNGDNIFNSNSGNVGIGTSAPSNKLQIGVGSNFAGFDFAITDGDETMVFGKGVASYYWTSNISLALLPGGPGFEGNVGINTSTPANKLQIGSLGGLGFNGNDLAIGNGSNAMVFAQTNTASQFASTTDFTFLPRYGSTGRVGINTTAPRAPLEVSGAILYSATNYSYITRNSYATGPGNCGPCTPTISILATNEILAAQFNAFSDARIKDIVGISNAAEDLASINAIQITNYTLKDKVANGNRPYKKVIAQQVEKVYPQIVSKHTDFIPNVYQLASTIEKTATGYLLTFTGEHGISNTAKKLQVILPGKVIMQQFHIVAVPTNKQVIINAADLKADKIFVYGEEVDDFRTIDYEGLTTLNISATQEISKLVKQQAKDIQQLNKKIDELQSLIGLLKLNSSVKMKKE